MPFPFTIKYKAVLAEKINTQDYPEILQYIKEFITKKTAEDITIENNTLTFKIGFFRFGWNWNIMVPIEKGRFVLNEKDEHTILSYQFFMYQLFIITTIMSVFMAVISQTPLFGVFCFFWLCGMNWIIALIRHRGMLDDITSGIDNLIRQKGIQTCV